jgi:Mrp family chromosome partitioning ATPase
MGSSVVVVTLKHPDARMVQTILQEVINDYLQRHKEIHSAGSAYDEALSREQSTLSVQLNETEQQLAKLKNQAGIISLADAKKDLTDQISKIRGAMSDAQVELAGYGAAINQTGGTPPEKTETTNAPPPVPRDQIDAYNSVCANLDVLQKKKQGYLLQGFTPGNALVQEVDAQISAVQKTREDFEEKYPQITSHLTVSPAAGGQSATTAADFRAQQVAHVTALQAKLKIWNAELDQFQMQATNLNSLEPIVAQLEQVKVIQQANLQILSKGLEESHIQAQINAGKAPNIKWVQTPSPPSRDWKKTNKNVGMLALGGILAGLAWAFLIELVLDRSVRRPTEIEAKLKVPLFLSIPDVSRNGHARRAEIAARRQLQLTDSPQISKADASPGGVQSASAKSSAMPVVSLEDNPALQPFCEALRDRLIVYFEVRNLTHKPKLVAVTSAGHGAGVSSIAAGLAASLSETGEGNVLLVDMNLEQGAAQQFYKGKAGCGLDTALKIETKQDALVGQNLYVVNGNAKSTELPGILPKRFAALVPRLKASDYDYIIFDMPPVSQTSLTSRLSRFMDMTLLVVESEKTGREVVQQANTWLAESGATVGAVLNKTRQYVPERLHQEFLGDK